MARLLALMALTAALLGGCVAVPCPGNGAATCYQPAAAPSPAYPYAAPYPAPYPPAYPAPYSAYAVPPGQPVVGPDGFTYVDGQPVAVIDGEQAVIVFDPGFGGWGYYDHYHRWHGAPPGMRERLERARPAGGGLPPGGFRGGGPPPGGPPPGAPPAGFRPGGGAPPPGAPPGRPAGPPPAAAQRPAAVPAAAHPPPPAPRPPRGCPQCTN